MIRTTRLLLLGIIATALVFFLVSSGDSVASYTQPVYQHVFDKTPANAPAKENSATPEVPVAPAAPQPAAEPAAKSLRDGPNIPKEAFSERPAFAGTPDSQFSKNRLLSSVLGKEGKGSAAKEKATFVSLTRNSELWEIVESIQQVEDRFNHQFHYSWVFLNDDDFTEEFKNITSQLVSGPTYYGKINESQWGFPEWIDQDRAAKVRDEMKEKKIIYGDSVSYRHMCRYESGFFFRHPLMMQFDYYWRVEPGIKLYCNVDYDVFTFMRENNYKYSFTESLYEYEPTIKTLWNETKEFFKQHPDYVAKRNSLAWATKEDGGYNNCHFWSNFEIASATWLRSQPYVDYFTHLDKLGGFFYERWGDAPVHTLAALYMLDVDEIHYFEDIGYLHNPFAHCPIQDKYRKKCFCQPSKTFDWKGYSCTKQYFDFRKWTKPQGWEDYSH